MTEQFRVGGDCKHGRVPDVCKDCNPVAPKWKLTDEDIARLSIEFHKNREDIGSMQFQIDWDQTLIQAQAKKLVEYIQEKYGDRLQGIEWRVLIWKAAWMELRRQVGLE